MFGIFKKDPIKELQKEYEKIMEKAVHAQRNGDIATFSKLSQEAEEVYKKKEELEKKVNS